jgi:hypothetical protein
MINNPIFLVGCMRSGTTLLADLLGSHPNIIHCPFELKHVWSRAGKVPMASPKTLDRICPQLNESDVKPGQKQKLVRAFHREMIKNKGKKHIPNSVFLNKNPHLCNKLPFVQTLFPNARFIWIYRDLPSVTASLKKLLKHHNLVHYWPYKSNEETIRCFNLFHRTLPKNIDRARCFPGGDAKYLAEYWYENNKAVSDFSKTVPPGQIFIIKEEELIHNPEKVLTECLDFLKLPGIIPYHIITNIQPGRNNLWHTRLSKRELESIMNFVKENEEKLNNLFPGQEISLHYKEQISSFL